MCSYHVSTAVPRFCLLVSQVFLVNHAPLLSCLACVSVYLNPCVSVVGCRLLFDIMLLLVPCSEFTLVYLFIYLFVCLLDY